MREIVFLLIVIPLAAFAQPETIPLNFEWEFDFGVLGCDDINLFKLCDPDSDDVPDFFCHNDNLNGDSCSIARLRDDQLIWQIEDFPYDINALEVMDADRDGVPTLWLASQADDSTQRIFELDIETGDIIRQNLEVECRKIYSFSSLVFAEDSAAYPIVGTGQFCSVPIWNGYIEFYLGNILKLDMENLTVEDSVFIYDYHRRFYNLISFTPNGSIEEKLFYGCSSYYHEDFTMHFETFQSAYCGVVDNNFNFECEETVYELNFNFEYAYYLGGQLINYIIDGFPCAAFLYRFQHDYQPYRQTFTKMYSLSDLNIQWEFEYDISYGDNICAVDLNNDSIEEVIYFVYNYINHDHFYVRNPDDGDIIGESDSVDVSLDAMAIINTPDGFALYVIEYEIVRKYSGGYLCVDELPGSSYPRSYELKPAYPNPFNSTVTIPFTVNRTRQVKIVIYNLMGREVETLLDASKGPGDYQVNWNADNLSSGIYLVSLESAGVKSQVRKIVLTK